MDDAVKHLTKLLRSGAITPQTYVERLSALAKTPPIPAPRQRREPPTPALRQRRERPTRPHASGGSHPRRPRAGGPALRWTPTSRKSSMSGPSRPHAGKGLSRPRASWCSAGVAGSFLRRWQMDVPKGHPHSADPRAFLEGLRPQIRGKLEEEIKDLCGVKFQLALKVQLRKDNPDGSEEYTDPMLRHKQEAILQNSEIEGPQSSFPHDPRNSGKVDAERVRLGCRSSGSPWAGHRQILATKRRLLYSTTSSGAT